MDHYKKILNHNAGTIYGALFILAMIPWVYFQIQRVIPADALFLSYAAGEFLSGKMMTESYFDNNPPMSYLIYIPVILIQKIGIELWFATLIYVFFLIALGTLCCAFIISRITELGKNFKIVFVCAYILCVTFPMSYEFGQKDHLIAIAILPFLLGQFALLNMSLTRKSDFYLNATLVIIFLIFVPFILIKPHYGLVPTAMIFYRWYKTRLFRDIFKSDFYILATGVVIYGFIINLFFPEFVSVALEIALKTYAYSSGDHYSAIIPIISVLFCGCLYLVVKSCPPEKTTEQQLSLIIIVMAALAIFPFALQSKGFSVHILPFLSVLSMAMVLTTYHFMLGKSRIFNKLMIGFVLIIILIGGFVMRPSQDTTHNYYINHPLMRELGIRKDDRSFFIENNTTNVVLQISVYNQIPHASRFPSNWVISDALATLDKEDLLYIQNLLAESFHADITQNRPEIVMLLNDENYAGYLTLLREHPKIKAALDLYESPVPFKTGQLYFKNSNLIDTNLEMQTYNIYRIKEPIE